MVHSVVNRMGMVWTVWVVMVVVVSVSFPAVVAKKAKKDPASYGLPPAPSSDCDGVAVAVGGATKVADRDDCTKYSLCLAAFGFKLDCPEGKHFSVADGFCTAPEKAGCDPAFAAAAPAAEDAAAAPAEDVPAAAAEGAAEEASGDAAEQAEQPAGEPAGDAGQAVEDVEPSADADEA